jgi:hypothetical protein
MVNDERKIHTAHAPLTLIVYEFVPSWAYDHKSCVLSQPGHSSHGARQSFDILSVKRVAGALRTEADNYRIDRQAQALAQPLFVSCWWPKRIVQLHSNYDKLSELHTREIK